MKIFCLEIDQTEEEKEKKNNLFVFFYVAFQLLM